jgi:UDP:flavonoid glycosyltransferase YjiC (YdhE family)
VRVLFTFIGGVGHFYPLVPLARAVEAAGHEVAVAGSGRLAARIEEAGFRALPTSEAGPGQAAPVPRDTAPPPPVDRHAAEVEFAENFADRGARRHAAAVLRVMEDWRPDLVVRDEADFGSGIAAEALGVPAAVVVVLAAGTLIRPELVGRPLAALRSEYGLAADPGLARLTADLVLAPLPPSFRSPSSPLALPPSTVWFRPGARVVRPVRPARPARPRVYATLGTVFGPESGDLFERLLAGLAGVDADVLVTVGWDTDPAVFGDQPGHVRVARFVPQDEVLGETDLMVSHGGSGSLLAALAHGVPSVLLPLGADQPHNAERAEQLGLARVLDASTATPDEIGRTVTAALRDQAMADRVRLVAEEVDRLPGPAAVVPALEHLARPT